MAASRGADCPAECCVYRRTDAFGLRPSHRCLAISGGPWRSSVGTVHRLDQEADHPLVSLALLQSSSCLRRPGVTRAPSLGSPASSRRQRCESTAGEHPRPTYVPPSAFRTLSTACSSHCLADLFHPAATSRLLAPGASSPDLTVPTSSVGLASAPLAPSPAAGLTRRRRSASRRPRGLLQAGIRSTDRSVTPHGCPCPLVRFCSFGLASPVSGASLPPPPLAVLVARCSLCPGQRTLSVSIDW